MAPSKSEILKRPIPWLLFGASLIAFAYFHQGGGWNQNGRFAMVRAMVEERHFWIDSYLIYDSEGMGGRSLKRTPIGNGEFVRNGNTYVLVWRDSKGRLAPVNNTVEGTVSALDPAARFVEILVGKEARFQIGWHERTRFSQNSREIPVSRMSAGKVVRVRYSVETDGRLTAQEIDLTDNRAPREVTFADLGQVGATGDVAFARGHFHPNKGPGAAFAAVPAYFLIYWVEKIFGVNPDGWRTFTLNAWLTSAFSVGLLTALACVLVYRLGLAWTGRPLASLLSALTFGFGTMMFPYATMLYEHNLVAVALLISFYAIYRVKAAPPPVAAGFHAGSDQSWFWLFLSGFCAGYTAIVNYYTAVLVVVLAIYVIWPPRRKNGWLWFGVGALCPLAALCGYNYVCFGNPFTTNYHYQNPLLNMYYFIWPQWQIFVSILISPFRGLFFSAPVLALGVYGLVPMFENHRLKIEAAALSAAFGIFLLLFISYNGWYGGWGTTPRYLNPVVPFLALPIVFGFVRFFRTTCALAALSVAMMFITTAVDPQSPLGSGGPGTVPGRPNPQEQTLAGSFAYDPFTEYELPLFFTGRAGGFLRSMVDGHLAAYDGAMAMKGYSWEARARDGNLMRANLESSIAHGNAQPFEIAGFDGPVSVNPMGLYEGWFYRAYAPHSPQAQMNSFNFGEFVFPGSLWSLVPLLVSSGGLIAIAVRMALKIQGMPRKTGKKTGR